MIIDGNSVAECWLGLLEAMVSGHTVELSPVEVNVHVGQARPSYADSLEQELNDFLRSAGQPRIETTANTIFPQSLANGSEGIYERFEKIWKYVKKEKKNRNGHYFRRLTAYGAEYGRRVNQLKHIVETYNGILGARQPVHRRSALIATTFDPTLDHSAQPQRGFPCLQQVCFLPNKHSNTLRLNAIYAVQYLSDRAYGNYEGLLRLGHFMAKEMNLQMAGITCVVSVLGLGKMRKSLAEEIVRKYC